MLRVRISPAERWPTPAPLIGCIRSGAKYSTLKYGRLHQVKAKREDKNAESQS